LIAAGAGSLKIPHQTIRNPLHVSTRYAKQAHAFVKLIGRVRTAHGQLLKLRHGHTELAGDPLQLGPSSPARWACATMPATLTRMRWRAPISARKLTWHPPTYGQPW
jgi:hypothetical protein